MTDRNIAGERFQLLTTFKSIYTNRSINAAANARGITQSAVSKHLQKLRDWFGDELFVRTSTGMQPTAKATAVIARVEHILQELEALNEESVFNPADIQGVFTIATTSEIIRQLTPVLLDQLRTLAPSLRITLINLTNDYSAHDLETGKVDLVISVNWYAPEHLIQKRLYSDSFVCVMSDTHPLAKKRVLTIHDYTNTDHIMVAPLGKQKGFIDEKLVDQGLKRKVRLSVPDFSQLVPDLLDEEHIVTLPHLIALELQKVKTLAIKKLPIDIPSFDYYMFWHRRFQNENTSRWMRNMVFDILSK